jgi:hypothetical protein
MFQRKIICAPVRGSSTNLARDARSFKALLLASVLALSLMGALITSAQASEPASILPLATTNNPPVVDPIGDKSVVEGSALNFTVTATDPDGDAVFLAAIGLPSGASFDTVTGEFSWTPLAAQVGNHSVAFLATDMDHYGSETITITVRSFNPPVMSPIGDKCVVEGSALNFTVTATDPDGDALFLAAIGLPSGASFDADTGEFSWTPLSGDAGSYPVTFGANDGIDSVSESITIAVVGTDQCPMLEELGDYETLEGMLLNFTVQAIDPNGDPVTLSATNLPDGATFDPGLAGSPAAGVFTWLPSYDQAGDYNLAFTATSGSPPLSSSETITITVEDMNRAPVLDAIGDKSVAEGSTLSFTVTASDLDGDEVVLAAIGLPSGASFDPGTGVFEWTPLLGDAGSYQVTFNATDSVDSASETITITVTEVEPTELLENLINRVREYGASKVIDNKGIVNSLIAKLESAQSKLESGNTKAASNILQAFINHVEAQEGKHITSLDAAQSLIDEAQVILAQLQGA